MKLNFSNLGYDHTECCIERGVSPFVKIPFPHIFHSYRPFADQCVGQGIWAMNSLIQQGKPKMGTNPIVDNTLPGLFY
jgi:hypothetical protein